MIRRQGRVQTAEASRYLQRLCYHFQRKIGVRYDEHQGEAEFPWGHCLLRAEDGALSFDCTAADADSLARVQLAIDSHLELFSRKNQVRAVWGEVEPLA